ncbi:hypothetical protein IMZ48_20205 [Candidatus Bathyarchaeota archaeon]|nr:hypothetical protein [Candidatus Bathyarchaeota archaeon]
MGSGEVGRCAGEEEMESGKENSGSWDVEGKRPCARFAGRLGDEDFAGTEERERKWPRGRRAEVEDRSGSLLKVAQAGATRMKLGG